MSFDPRILFVDQTGKLGGAELCLTDVVVHLRDRCTVFLFESGPFQELLERNGVPVVVPTRVVPLTQVRKNSKITAHLLAVPAFLRLTLSLIKVARGYDLLYANTAKALLAVAISALVLRKPFLFHLHDIINAQHFSRLNRWLLVTAANLATGIIANSEATAAAYRSAGGKSSNLAVVPNGFQVERFLADVPSRSREVQTLIGSQNKPLVGMFGRITAWKGQKVLIQALSHIPDVHAVIVGDALFTDEDQDYKQMLSDLAERLGVAHRVHFIGFQPDILPFLKAVDLVVHCSTSPEPFGRVIVEALLAGTPVIAARCGAPSEILEDGVTGVLVDPEDPSELAGAIQQLLRDRSWAHRLARAGQDSVSRRFALDRVLEDWTDFINSSVQRALTKSKLKTSKSLAPRRESEREAKPTGA